MNLAVLPDLETQVLLVIENLAGHYRLGANNVRYFSSRWEGIKHSDAIEHNVYRQKLWNPLEWEAVPTSSALFLHNSNSSLDLWEVLVSTRQVDHRVTRHRLNQNP